MRENEKCREILIETDMLTQAVEKGEPLKDKKGAIGKQLEKLSEIELHYVKKENEIFPYLEKHDIKGPPQVMWGVHNDIRKLLKESKAKLEALDDTAIPVIKEFKQTVRGMIYKEENILFPLCVETIEEAEWQQIKKGFNEIGYVWIKDSGTWGEEKTEKKEASEIKGSLNLDVGHLSPEQVNLVLHHLPFDISFVDENDELLFYGENFVEDRIFPRSPGVIGRKVQNCHPPKSVSTVEKILEAFKKGEKDNAEFWLQMGGKFIYIRYYAVRDKEGKYKGCLEVMQEVSRIRSLEGERKLLDWE
jgi:hypothetical protein